MRIKQPFKEPLQEYSFSFEIPFTDNASIDNALLCLGVVLSCQPWTSPDIASVVKLDKLEPVEMRLELKKVLIIVPSLMIVIVQI